MSIELNKRLQAFVESKRVLMLLENVPHLEVIGFTTMEWDDLVPLSTRDYAFNGNHPPTTQLDNSAPNSEAMRWLDNVWKLAQLEGLCYLFMNQYSDAPWVQVKLPASSEWLTTLCQQVHYNLNIVSLTTSTVLFLREQEYIYEARIMDRFIGLVKE